MHSFLGPGLLATVMTRDGDSAGKPDRRHREAVAACAAPRCPSVSLHFAGGSAEAVTSGSSGPAVGSGRPVGRVRGAPAWLAQEWLC